MIKTFVTVSRFMGGVLTSFEAPCSFANVDLLKQLTEELTNKYERGEIAGFEISAFAKDEDEEDDEE